MILQMGPPPWSGGNPPNGPFAPCISCIPIDQGALWLIVVGLIVGIYFLIDERSKNRKL